jgi:hypothetical protein
MRIVVEVRIEDAGRAGPERVTIGVIERDADSAPSSGLGLFLQETKDLLQKLQAIVVEEQTARFVAAASKCPACEAVLGVKDRKQLVYRTAFGIARLASPRLYSRCAGCGTMASCGHTFSPLAQAVPERTRPQRTWLQCRYASVMSFRLAQIFLRNAFPAGKSLAVPSLKVNVRTVGTRLETEAQEGVRRVITQLTQRAKKPAVKLTTVALQIDAGYIRAAPRPDGVTWIAAVASKVAVPQATRTPAHAYVTGYNPHQGMRQQAFLASIGVGLDVPVTVLSDGGGDISHACHLAAPTERVLDWFHIGMRFEHLLIALRGLRRATADDRAKLERRAEGAKWLLWHGQQKCCLERLESLRRDTGWAGAKNPLGRLIRYLTGSAEWLINYQRRRAQKRPISSAGADSAVDYVIGQRMKRNGHMRWSPEGANAMLQVRCAVLNGQDVRNFVRWYPPNQRLDFTRQTAMAA